MTGKVPHTIEGVPGCGGIPARSAVQDALRRRPRHFAQFSLRHRVLLSQLPLTVSAALVTVAVLLFEPWMATDAPHFTVGLAGIPLLTLAAWLTPWERCAPITYWVIPVLDFVAIAPFWSAARHALDGMSMLAAFPVVWLAWTGIRPVLAVSLGFFGSAEDTIKATPAYDVAPTRWSGVDITPTRVIGAWGEGGEDPTEYAFASYHVTANQLLAQNTDPESLGLNRTLLARPFEAHIGLWMVRFEGNDRWQIQGIDSNWSAIGTPVEELEHPWD